MRSQTVCVHADDGVEDASGAVSPPIHTSTTFRVAREGPGEFIYSRYDTPTRRRAEAVLGAVEGGRAVLYASGLAACRAALLHFNPRRIVFDHHIGYHGTRQNVDLLREERGGSIELVDTTATLAKGDLVWIESPNNPTMKVYDLEAIARRARAAGAFVVVDSTMASPVVQQPLNFGVHMVMHSATKYLAGHSDALVGALVVPDEASHKRLLDQRAIIGGTPGSLESWLLLRSMRTLSLRVERQCANACRVAAFLASRPEVAEVLHTSLPSHPDHELATRQLRRHPACLSIHLRSEAMAKEVAHSLKLFQFATSLGGVESLVDWRKFWDDTCPGTLLRFSLGVEDAEDLIADLSTALERAAGGKAKL